MHRTTIVMADRLQDEAKELGINVSEICREAVAAAVEAVRIAKRFGDEFKTVRAKVELIDGEIEVVQFVGRLVYTDPQGEEFYVTSGGRPALIDQDGEVHYGDTIDELGVGIGYERQVLEEALGHAVTPTFLDI